MCECGCLNDNCKCHENCSCSCKHKKGGKYVPNSNLGRVYVDVNPTKVKDWKLLPYIAKATCTPRDHLIQLWNMHITLTRFVVQDIFAYSENNTSLFLLFENQKHMAMAF